MLNNRSDAKAHLDYATSFQSLSFIFSFPQHPWSQETRILANSAVKQIHPVSFNVRDKSNPTLSGRCFPVLPLSQHYRDSMRHYNNTIPHYSTLLHENVWTACPSFVAVSRMLGKRIIQVRIPTSPALKAFGARQYVATTFCLVARIARIPSNVGRWWSKFRKHLTSI